MLRDNEALQPRAGELDKALAQSEVSRMYHTHPYLSPIDTPLGTPARMRCSNGDLRDAPTKMPHRPSWQAALRESQGRTGELQKRLDYLRALSKDA